MLVNDIVVRVSFIKLCLDVLAEIVCVLGTKDFFVGEELECLSKVNLKCFGVLRYCFEDILV